MDGIYAANRKALLTFIEQVSVYEREKELGEDEPLFFSHLFTFFFFLVIHAFVSVFLSFCPFLFLYFCLLFLFFCLLSLFFFLPIPLCQGKIGIWGHVHGVDGAPLEDVAIYRLDLNGDRMLVERGDK